MGRPAQQFTTHSFVNPNSRDILPPPLSCLLGERTLVTQAICVAGRGRGGGATRVGLLNMDLIIECDNNYIAWHFLWSLHVPLTLAGSYDPV